jgi:hypothetical protein
VRSKRQASALPVGRLAPLEGAHPHQIPKGAHILSPIAYHRTVKRSECLRIRIRTSLFDCDSRVSTCH